jgi:citrate synthase
VTLSLRSVLLVAALLLFGIVEGSAIDISSLRAQTGHITLDPGYGNTGSCESAITFIDGDQGILRYRGIPIEQFADKPNFIETAWLLIFGHLPSEAEYEAFSADLTRFANLDEGMKHHFEGFPATRRRWRSSRP